MIPLERWGRFPLPAPNSAAELAPGSAFLCPSGADAGGGPCGGWRCGVGYVATARAEIGSAEREGKAWRDHGLTFEMALRSRSTDFALASSESQRRTNWLTLAGVPMPNLVHSQPLLIPDSVRSAAANSTFSGADLRGPS